VGVTTLHAKAARWYLVAVSLVGASAFGGGLLTATAAAGVKHFKNCTAVHKTYPHGIARSAKAAATANGLHGTPKISLALYKANSKMDRDRDGVACER
jgi:Excalibur calcium-binding domain